MFKLKTLLVSLFLFLSLIFLPFSIFAVDETLTVTTYYPSPYGSYNEFKVASNTYLAYSSGSVGIGTTDPGYKLDVVDTATTNGGVIEVWSKSRNTIGDTATLRFGVGLHGYRSSITGIQLNAGNNDGGLGFHVYDASTALGDIEAVRIDRLGNVGIGTTGPLTKLDVVGDVLIRSGNALYVSNNASLNGAYINSPAVNAIGFATNLSEKMRLSATGGLSLGSGYIGTDPGAGNMIISGNVGIGTTGNTVYKLAVNSGTSDTTYNDIGIGGGGGWLNNEEHTINAYYSNTTAANKLGSIIFHYSTSPNEGSIRFGNIYNAGNNSAVAMTITGGGNVGIGTTEPNGKLVIAGTNVNSLFEYGTNEDTYINSGKTAGVVVLQQVGGNVGIGTTGPGYLLTMESSGGGYYSASDHAWHNGSSIRWKEDIQPITNALGTIKKLQGVSFKWKPGHGGHKDIGFIAEEVGKVIPEVVSLDPKAPGFANGMDYAKLTAILVEGVKEQQNQIQKQAKDIEALKQELIGSTAMLMESNKNLKANTKEIQDLKAEIVSLEGKVSGKQ